MYKNRNEEYISIADLMGGFVAVLLLLLVSSLLRDTRDPATIAVTELKNAIVRKGLTSKIDISVEDKYLTFRDREDYTLFEQSSACINKSLFVELGEDFKTSIQTFLKSKGSLIFIEGHADANPVKAPVTDCLKHCGCYDDNLTLSTLRARAFREFLIDGLPPELAKNVAIAGFGAEHLLEGVSPNDSKNRRVELRFVSQPQQYSFK